MKKIHEAIDAEGMSKKMKKEETESERTHPKERLLKSKAYKDKTDLLHALLEDGKSYTRAQVDKRVNAYLEKEVK